jgi:hypothetical protein
MSSRRVCLTVVVLFCSCGGVAAHADILADSSSDFTGVQRSRGWYYGFVQPGSTSAVCPSAQMPFQMLPVYDAQDGRWQQIPVGGTPPPWTEVGAYSTMTPNTTEPAGTQYAVRRWVSSTTGTVLVSGALSQPTAGPQLGAGVHGYLCLNGQIAWDGKTDGISPLAVPYGVNRAVTLAVIAHRRGASD